MEAALAYVEYENVKKKERSVIGIHQLAMNRYYPKDVKVSSFELNQEPPNLQIQSHMFVYVPEIKGRHLASLVFLTSADEKIDRIESGFEGGAYIRWKSCSGIAQNGQMCFYCPAKFKGKKENSEEDFADTANEVTSSGVWNIHVYHSEEKLLKIKVKIIPSISEEDYQAMLKDLVRIQQELALDAGGSTGFAAKWEHIYTDLAQQISDMKAVVKEIMLSPKTNLHQEYTLQSIQKIKKYSPRTIQDVYIKGRQTVNAISYSEDYDIYEHRAIKRYLLQIRRLCDQYSSLAENEKNENIDELKRICKDYIDAGNKETINDVQNRSPHTDEEFFKREVKCKQNYYEELTEERRTKKQFERIKSDIDVLMNNPLLRDVKPSNGIHITPVFQRDSRYRKAFEIMKRYRKQLKIIDLVDQSRYPVRKTCDIYEYWIFAKMLSIFCTEYSFIVRQFGQQKEDASFALIEDISSYITQGDYNGTDVLLYHEGLDLNVEIKFNGLLKQKGKPNSSWRPDYQLIIKIDDRIYHFCMDAKYRNYSKQGEQWKRDLIDVAKVKYIDKAEEYINGSYILHSDAKCRPFYAGNPSLITNTIGEKLGSGYVCRIGSVALLPQRTEHFKTLLQMIFEYFIGDEIGYRKKCWMCGSDKIVVKRLRTGGRRDKYHMTCENPACKAFWVENHCSEEKCDHREFGKHLHNYLEEKTPGESWMVKCPICEYGGAVRRNSGNATDSRTWRLSPEEYEEMMPPKPGNEWKWINLW